MLELGNLLFTFNTRLLISATHESADSDGRLLVPVWMIIKNVYKIFHQRRADLECDLNLTRVTGTTNGIIFQITNLRGVR